MYTYICHTEPPSRRDGFPTHPYLSQQITNAHAKLLRHPDARKSFLIQDKDGTWRAPAVNETCCKRPTLAKFLEDGVWGVWVCGCVGVWV